MNLKKFKWQKLHKPNQTGTENSYPQEKTINENG
jgi:hypothetical protein